MKKIKLLSPFYRNERNEGTRGAEKFGNFPEVVQLPKRSGEVWDEMNETRFGSRRGTGNQRGGSGSDRFLGMRTAQSARQAARCLTERARELWEPPGRVSPEPPHCLPQGTRPTGSRKWRRASRGVTSRRRPRRRAGGGGGANCEAWGAAAQSPGSPGLEGGLRAAGWLCHPPRPVPSGPPSGLPDGDRAQRSLSKERVRRGAGGREEHDIAEVRSPEGPGAGLGPAPAAFGRPRPGGGAPGRASVARPGP